MPRVEDSMAEALSLMRVAGLAEFGRAPKTAQDSALQVKAYLSVLEAEIDKLASFWNARVSSGLIHASALAAASSLSNFPSALEFAEIAIRSFKAEFELLSVAIDGGGEFLLYTVPRGAGEALRERMKFKALRIAGVSEALPSRRDAEGLSVGARELLEDVVS